MAKLGRPLLFSFAFAAYACELFSAEPSEKTPEEIAAFVETHRKLIFGAEEFFYRTLKNIPYDQDDIEELAWESLRMTARKHNLTKGAVSTLFYTSLRNKLIDYARRREVRTRHLLKNSEGIDWTTIASVPNSQAVRLEKVRIFWENVKDLVPFATEFEITQFRGISYTVAATTLGIPEGTLKSRVSRCRKVLAEVVESLDIKKADFLNSSP